MRNVKKGFVKSINYFCLIGVVALGLMTIVATGGGGDNNDIVDEEPSYLNVYKYYLNTTSDLNISYTESSDTYTITIATPGRMLAGTFNRLTEVYSLDSGSGVQIDSGTSLFETFSMEVITTLQIPPDTFPTAGSFEVAYGLDIVEATVVNTPPEGVELSLNSGVSEFFSWNAFEDLFGSAAPDWQQRASLSFLLMEFMLEQTNFVIDTFRFIGDYDDELQQNTTAVEMCDAFPPGAAPDDILEQGSHELTWHDNGNGEVGGGDDFTWTFTDCWDNDPTDNFDDLINGIVDLSGYTEAVDSSNRVTRIGFEDPAGGVVFNNFLLLETEESPPGTFNIDPSSGVTVNGGFKIVFTE